MRVLGALLAPWLVGCCAPCPAVETTVTISESAGGALLVVVKGEEDGPGTAAVAVEFASDVTGVTLVYPARQGESLRVEWRAARDAHADGRIHALEIPPTVRAQRRGGEGEAVDVSVSLRGDGSYEWRR
ncbi:MAG: hypothetical protein KIT58_18070 [Planctomycetota bacterium]|nr:hypothetical protein [Planctomycetota bacterium]